MTLIQIQIHRTRRYIHLQRYFLFHIQTDNIQGKEDGGHQRTRHRMIFVIKEGIRDKEEEQEGRRQTRR